MPHTRIKRAISERHPITFKICFVGILVLLLLIPVGMVRSLIDERQGRAHQAQQNIMSLWGGTQTIGGPVLTVPFQDVLQTDKGPIEVTRQAVFLPELLTVEGTVTTEIRYRGIFEVPVYTAELAFSGWFDPDQFSLPRIEDEAYAWEEAMLTLGLSDPRGIKDGVVLDWLGEEASFGPRKRDMEIFEGLIQCPIVNLADLRNNTSLEFSFNLALSGGKQIRFLPMGRETRVTVTSPWTTPSFQGAYLPQERTLTKSGFTATWKVLELGRNFPQGWGSGEIHRQSIVDNAFGFDLFAPVDVYQMTTRSAKYAILFIVLTFLGFFLFEVFGDGRIHPIQYLMVGFALVLFYLLELSLSEHIPFAWAYAIGAVGIIAMITFYAYFVLGQAKRTGIVMAILSIIYSFLFVLLQAEDYALLLGSVGLFAALGIVMYVTRSIDWYAVNEPAPPPVPESTSTTS